MRKRKQSFGVRKTTEFGQRVLAANHFYSTLDGSPGIEVEMKCFWNAEVRDPDSEVALTFFELAVQLLKRRIEDPEYRESHLPVEQ
jgi:hypothetical protein